MKIIKDGRLVKQATCSYCGCVYESEGKDVLKEFDYAISMVYPKSIRKYVQCPQCNEVYYLNKPDEVGDE